MSKVAKHIGKLILSNDKHGEFDFNYNDDSVSVMNKSFNIEKITNDVYLIANDDVSFFIIYDEVDKCWTSSIEDEIKLKENIIEKYSKGTLHQYVALHCLGSILKEQADFMLGTKVKNTIDKILGNIPKKN